MLRLLQVAKIVNDKQFFVDIFDDLSFELEEMGYKDCPEDLVQDLLINHFDLEIECERQLKDFTNDVLKHQGKIGNYVNLMV